MAYKRLGATTVTASVSSTMYTVPTSKIAVISSLVVCNLGTTTRKFRIALVEGSLSNKDYIYYDVSLPFNQTFIATCGFTISAGMTIVVQADHEDLVFSAFGMETTA